MSIVTGYTVERPRGSPVKHGVLRQVKPKGPKLRFQFNPESVIERGGGAVYQDVPRPLRKTAQEFVGVAPKTITFTLFFDGFPNTSIEDEIAMLKSFVHPRAKGKPGPELELDYGPTAQQARWIIKDEDFSPGPELRNRGLAVVRQEFTITLTEYVEADVALTPAEKHKQKKAS